MAKVKTWASAGKLAEGSHCLGIWRFYLEADEDEEKDDLEADEDEKEDQGVRTWQPFVGSKNGNENFGQARIYNIRVKCVVFARNRKFAKLTQ